MSGYKKVYVEGPDDRDVLEKVFPKAKGVLTVANAKSNVLKKVTRELDSCGIVDRDFDYTDDDLSNNSVEASRLVILERYCMESYLLEPAYLLAYAQEFDLTHLPDWESEQALERFLIRKGQELCFYSAANELLTKIRAEISYRTLTQKFDEFPIKEQAEIRTRLHERFERLPVRDELDGLLHAWETRGQEIHALCAELKGVHRWVDGKILLRKVIVQNIRESDKQRFAKYNDEDFIDDLLDLYAVRINPPTGLAAILTNVGLLP